MSIFILLILARGSFVEHLFFICNKTQCVWSQIEALIGKCIAFPIAFFAGNCLTNQGGSDFIKSVIAAVTWDIWKACYDMVFHHTLPNFVTIARRANCFAKDFFHPYAKNIRKKTHVEQLHL